MLSDVQLHPGLPKTEKRKICSLMDVKKLSKGACIHAAQNDRLPLRVVVQVLFFEQLRAAGAAAAAAPVPNGSMARCMARLAEEEEDDDWKDGRAPQEPPTPGALKKQLGSLKLAAPRSVRPRCARRPPRPPRRRAPSSRPGPPRSWPPCCLACGLLGS